MIKSFLLLRFRRRKAFFSILIAWSVFSLLFINADRSCAEGPVRARRGEEFTISLLSNPSTGYLWRLSRVPDERLAEKVGSGYSDPDTGLLGAPGEQWWTFKAKGDGRTAALFEYARPWENGSDPVERKKVEIMIIE